MGSVMKFLRYVPYFEAFLVATITASIVMIFLHKAAYAPQSTTLEGEGPVATNEPESYNFEDTDDTINIVLIGHGGAGHPGGGLADTIQLLHIEPDTRRAALISIPRDLWVAVPARSDRSDSRKINEAYAIGISDTMEPLKQPKYSGTNGGGTLIKDVVSTIIGAEVDYYAAIDFENFKLAVDTLGGINVEIPVTFDDYFYPVPGLENETCGLTNEQIEEAHRLYSGFDLEKQFICRYEHLHFDQGVNTLDGSTALKFVRSRHSDQHGGDFARAQRQFALLVGIKNKLLSLNALQNSRQLYDQFSDMIRTDIGVGALSPIIELIGNPDEYNVSHVQLSTANTLMESRSSSGQFILIPKTGENNWTEVQNFIWGSL